MLMPVGPNLLMTVTVYLPMMAGPEYMLVPVGPNLLMTVTVYLPMMAGPEYMLVPVGPNLLMTVTVYLPMMVGTRVHADAGRPEPADDRDRVLADDGGDLEYMLMPVGPNLLMTVTVYLPMMVGPEYMLMPVGPNLLMNRDRVPCR